MQLVGSILAVSSGLPVGKEGPLLHIGASLAAIIGERGYLFGLIRMRPREQQQFFMNQETRELVAVGAVAGVASAFKAPVRAGRDVACSEGLSWRRKGCFWRVNRCIWRGRAWA